MKKPQPGQKAYEADSRNKDGKAPDGKPLQQWSELTDAAKAKWAESESENPE
jgi:hypothetical protein